VLEAVEELRRLSRESNFAHDRGPEH
jgi:hypothetical protein